MMTSPMTDRNMATQTAALSGRLTLDSVFKYTQIQCVKLLHSVRLSIIHTCFKQFKQYFSTFSSTKQFNFPASRLVNRLNADIHFLAIKQLVNELMLIWLVMPLLAKAYLCMFSSRYLAIGSLCKGRRRRRRYSTVELSRVGGVY